MTNQQWELLVLNLCCLLAVTQPSLCLISEDAAAALLAGLENAVDFKIPVALLP